MRAIVAVDNNWAIGKDNNLLFHIKDDLARFKTITMGHAVVMGRKTFESLPGKKPLHGRDNYILTRDKNYTVEGAVVVHSYDEFRLKYAYKYTSYDIFVIGGAEIYNLFFDDIDDAYVTKIYNTVDGADKFFPNLDIAENWEKWHESDVYTDENGISYQFLLYHNAH